MERNKLLSSFERVIYVYNKKQSTPTKEDKTMWNEGTIAIKNNDGSYTNCRYWAKHFDEPSEEYGIEGGRISKLMIKVNGKITLNYDRGWDVEPEDEASQMAFAFLMQKYN